MVMQSNHSRHFEELVATLLVNLGKSDVTLNSCISTPEKAYIEIDISFGKDRDYTIAELKRYRYSSPPSPSIFDRALRQTLYIKKQTGAASGVLIISCPLTPELEEFSRAYLREIAIWDANHLLEMALPYPDIYRDLEQLFEISTSPSGASQYIQLDNGSARIPNKGEQLAKKLKAIIPGKAQAFEFEKACINSLRYIFDSDLHGWHEQNTTEDDLHRRDLICRILPNSEVWRLMLTDIRSRYVIFEFKNYTAPITPHEITTTERYLFPAALRTVAIVISPKGCSASAEKVIKGAMREQGKLILPLTVAEIEKLLTSKDKGEDPNTYLFDRVDDFLMRLGR